MSGASCPQRRSKSVQKSGTQWDIKKLDLLHVSPAESIEMCLFVCVLAQQNVLIRELQTHHRQAPVAAIAAILRRFLPTIGPSCLLFFFSLPNLSPFFLTSFPLHAEVLGRGGAGQGALHARAGEVPEDRSLQALQKEGPGEAEGQADQGRWGRLKQRVMKPLRSKISFKLESLCKWACDASRLTVLLSADVIRLMLKVLCQQGIFNVK